MKKAILSTLLISIVTLASLPTQALNIINQTNSEVTFDVWVDPNGGVCDEKHPGDNCMKMYDMKLGKGANFSFNSFVDARTDKKITYVRLYIKGKRFPNGSEVMTEFTIDNCTLYLGVNEPYIDMSNCAVNNHK
jgi:hypothetical protein